MGVKRKGKHEHIEYIYTWDTRVRDFQVARHLTGAVLETFSNEFENTHTAALPARALQFHEGQDVDRAAHEEGQLV